MVTVRVLCCWRYL